MNKEKEAFAERLRETMRAAGHEPRPVVLERLFNTNYRGRSVTFQAVSGWLSGRSIPSQDKLQVLANVLGAQPQYLRFGEGASWALREKGMRWDWDKGLAPEDREMMDALLGLPIEQKKIVREIIQAFAAKCGRT